MHISPSRRAASLGAVSRNAKLGKGENFSGLLSIQNDYPKPKAAAKATRMSSSYLKRPARVVATTRATKVNLAGAIRGLARANGPSSCPKQPTSKGNCFKYQPNRLPPRVKHGLARNCQSDPFRHRRLHGGSVLLSIDGSTAVSADRLGEGPFAASCRCLFAPQQCAASVHIRKLFKIR